MPSLPRIGRSLPHPAPAADDLVARARRGDRDAFSRLVEDRLERLFRTATAILGNEADARDAVQDAFVSAWQHLPKLRDSARFDAWLNQVVRNQCRDLLRRQRRSREIQMTEFDPVTPDSTAPIADMAALNAAFGRLNVDQRLILVLHHLHGIRVEDLASQLDVPVGTAKWRLHAARQALERALEAEA